MHRRPGKAVTLRHYLFNPRAHSLVRGNVLVLASLVASFLIAGFPADRPTGLLVFPLLIAMAGTVDTLRCMRKTWSLYHGGVLLLGFMDIMSVFLILFLFLYPYLPWFAATR